MYRQESEKDLLQSEGSVIERASALELSPDVFINKLAKVNAVYDRIMSLGPFYGKDIKGQNPSFRVTAEPLLLPRRFQEELKQLGQDIYVLAGCLVLLPSSYRAILGDGWSLHTPFSLRIDAIIDDQDKLYVNEVQISDGGDGRMIGLQLAYGLGTLQDSTAWYTVDFIKDRYTQKGITSPRIAFIRQNLVDSPYATNAKRMQEFLAQASGEDVQFSLVDRDELDMVNWDLFDGVINYAYVRENDLVKKGIDPDKILCVGDASYIGSKALFALLHDSKLNQFWQQVLGEDIFQRLRSYFIPSTIIESKEQITQAKDNRLVVKTYDSERLSMLGAARGVFGPWNLGEEEWLKAYMIFGNGGKLIEQKYIVPKKFPAFLRSHSGKNLERVSWYNRICAKYVAPTSSRKEVVLTGLEATLGKNEKPSGVGCAFTSIDFHEAP